MDYVNFFQTQLHQLHREGRYRTFAALERLQEDAPCARWHRSEHDVRDVVVWCSNDYLNMSHHPAVIEAACLATREHGVGSGGTRNIAGTCIQHVELEQTVAQWHKKKSGLIFSSGFCANEASLSALGRGLPQCVIFSDEKNHASMIAGIQHSGARKEIFAHNNLADLEEKLRAYPLDVPKIIAFISVYSMDGDLAPIEQIASLAKKYNALTYLDEVHAVGLYGPQGAGMAAALDLESEIDIIQGNFAKAVGVVGGYIAADTCITDYIRSFASGFIFTTSLPPAVACAARTSIELLQRAESERKRDQLKRNVNYLNACLAKTNIPFIPSQTHIVPIVIGNAFTCREISTILLEEHDIYVQPINYPTVPRGQERLRVTVSPMHTSEHIEHFVFALETVWNTLSKKVFAA